MGASDAEVPQVLELDADRFSAWEADLRQRRESWHCARGSTLEAARSAVSAWLDSAFPTRDRPPHQRVFDVQLAGRRLGTAWLWFQGPADAGEAVLCDLTLEPDSVDLVLGGVEAMARALGGVAVHAQATPDVATGFTSRGYVPSLVTWIKDWPSDAGPVDFPGAPTGELVPMTEAQLGDFVAALQEDEVRHRVRAGVLSGSEGAGQMDAILERQAQGLPNPGQLFRSVVVEGRVVAEVWQSVDPGVSHINYLRVPPALRGSSYAKASMAALSRDALSRGERQTQMSTYPHNTVMTALLQGAGCRVAEIRLRKDL